MTILSSMVRTARVLGVPLIPSRNLVTAYFELADERVTVSDEQWSAWDGRASRQMTPATTSEREEAGK